jgi:hypothetical protein
MPRNAGKSVKLLWRPHSKEIRMGKGAFPIIKGGVPNSGLLSEPLLDALSAITDFLDRFLHSGFGFAAILRFVPDS